MICKTKVKKSGDTFMSVIPPSVVKKMRIHENEEIIVQFKGKSKLSGFGLMKDVKDVFVRDDSNDTRL